MNQKREMRVDSRESLLKQNYRFLGFSAAHQIYSRFASFRLPYLLMGEIHGSSFKSNNTQASFSAGERRTSPTFGGEASDAIAAQLHLRFNVSMIWFVKVLLSADRQVTVSVGLVSVSILQSADRQVRIQPCPFVYGKRRSSPTFGGEDSDVIAVQITLRVEDRQVSIMFISVLQSADRKVSIMVVSGSLNGDSDVCLGDLSPHRVFIQKKWTDSAGDGFTATLRQVSADDLGSYSLVWICEILKVVWGTCSPFGFFVKSSGKMVAETDIRRISVEFRAEMVPNKHMGNVSRFLNYCGWSPVRWDLGIRVSNGGEAITTMRMMKATTLQVIPARGRQFKSADFHLQQDGTASNAGGQPDFYYNHVIFIVSDYVSVCFVRSVCFSFVVSVLRSTIPCFVRLGP
jgi:hypothetical protein